jgi:hypothetical protein
VAAVASVDCNRIDSDRSVLSGRQGLAKLAPLSLGMVLQRMGIHDATVHGHRPEGRATSTISTRMCWRFMPRS